MAPAASVHFVLRIFGELQFAFDRFEHAGDRPDVPHAALLRGEAVALHGGGDAVADFDVDDAGLGTFDREIEVVAFGAFGVPEFFSGVEGFDGELRQPLDDEQFESQAGSEDQSKDKRSEDRGPRQRRHRRRAGRRRSVEGCCGRRIGRVCFWSCGAEFTGWRGGVRRHVRSGLGNADPREY